MDKDALIMPLGAKDPNEGHCDFEIRNFKNSRYLRYFLLVHRMSAIDRALIVECYGEPKCFADHNGKRVRLTMASRFGDVGISSDLRQPHGYSDRVMVRDLENFSDHK